ncbi:hypothetical protein [Lacipirellula limnantheis]|uniref:LTXXQ motif protein n=1 Tax=Lacipirellula limnantheis TaxID=2528024 RepID=A0A517U056_9BACT|nr:hypothetical protein [Lacipirellula limnantheis]QDT74006.1 hypothetical protein I41_31990 [Lacipirellula limnantheis]
MKKSEVCGIVGVAMLAVLVAWFYGWFDGKAYSDDPQVAALEKERDANVDKLANMPEDQRRTQGEAFRKQMEGLSPDQRAAFMESSMAVFVPLMARQFEKNYDEFMAKSPEEQRRELDKRIDEMEARGGQGGPGGPGRGGPPNMDPKKMDEFRKKMLDYTTPEQRAKFENGIQIFNDRRKERGLPPVGPPGGRPF